VEIENTGRAAVASKLAQAVQKIGPVLKAGRNEHFQYNYAMEADVLQAVREALAEVRLVVVPRLIRVEDREIRSARQDGSEKVTVITTCYFEFDFTDSESGQTLTVPWAGRGEDPSDKGIYKAMTGAEKYVLMKTFMIPTHDDPEADAKNDKRVAARQGRPSGPGKPGAPSANRKMDCPRCSRPMRWDDKKQEFYCWKAKGGCGAVYQPDTAVDGAELARREGERERAAAGNASELPGSRIPPRDTEAERERYRSRVQTAANELQDLNGEVTIEADSGIPMLIGQEEYSGLGFSGPCALADLTVDQLSRVGVLVRSKINAARKARDGKQVA
jgi:hypothetical protein